MKQLRRSQNKTSNGRILYELSSNLYIIISFRWLVWSEKLQTDAKPDLEMIRSIAAEISNAAECKYSLAHWNAMYGFTAKSLQLKRVE